MKNVYLLACAIVLSVNALAQNLIPNTSFEKTSGEPEFGCEFTLVHDWKNPSAHYCYNYEHGTPDLFSHFATGYSILPNSFMGTTEPHTGDRCAGIVTYISNSADHREYMTSPLTTPLVPGNTYTVSFWRTSGYPASHIYHSNKLQIAFTMDTLHQEGKDPITGVVPQLSVDSVMRDSIWTLYSFQYTATDAFEYFTIGNFEYDANTIVEDFGTDRPYAYHFLDDISVESNVVGINEVKDLDATIYPNPSTVSGWFIETSNEMIGSTIEVYEYSGRLMYTNVIINSKSEINFNAANGIYILKLTNGGNTVSKKIIKL